MTELLSLSIGFGLAVSLLFTELFGLAAGGMVVPGYIALHLDRPIEVALTLTAALVTFGIVHAISSVVIIYGRRRTVAMILVGYMVGMFVRWITAGVISGADEYVVIGFIIPGLIAIWIDRQGLVETLCSLLTASAVVRLVLVLTVGSELRP